MRLAIVHCRIAPGGALNVLKDLITQESFSEAKIFAIHSTQETLTIHNKKISISPIIPKRLHFIDHRFWMPFYPIIMWLISQKIKFYKPDHILISSFAIAKNISFCRTDAINRVSPRIPTTLYLHSPMQYIRSHYTEYIHKITGYKKILFKFVTPYLRKRDLKYTKYNKIIANSRYTADEAKKLYTIESKVSYPKIQSAFFHESIEENILDYYVCVGRLVRFVREVDTIIKLFNHTKQHLILIGSGPDEEYLKSIAGDTITFVGQLPQSEIIQIVKKSRGLINLTKESFGIGTAEALCLGVPIFGYNDGATPELVDYNSGILVENKSHQHLLEKFEEFSERNWNRNYIAERARKKFAINE